MRFTSYMIGLVCVWLAALLAHAQPKQDQPEYVTTMVDAFREYNAGKYPEARALLQRVHELQPNARTLRGLGLVEYKLNHRAEALRLLTAAVNDTRKALAPAIKRETEKLIQDLRMHLGSYRIVVSPAEWTMTVDGSPADASEQPLLLEVGEHLLSVRSPGYQSQDRRVNVRGGETEELRFDLVPEAPMVATAPPAPEAPLSAKAAARPLAARQLPEPPPSAKLAARSTTAREEQSPLAQTTWGFIALGTSAISLAGTVIAWRIGESAAERWNDDNRCLLDGGTREQNCGADQDTAKTARTWATAGLITTGVLAAAATILLWPRQQHSERSTARSQCFVAGIGLACTVGL